MERHAWIPTFGIDYYVGIDGISLLLLVLTTFLTPIALLSSWERHPRSGSRSSRSSCCCLEAAMIGVFVSLDLFLFYVFWDFMLIPMYFLIGIWGYDRRIYAVDQVLALHDGRQRADAGRDHRRRLAAPAGHRAVQLRPAEALRAARARDAAVWFFLAFAVAFAIKVPLFPFHTWLPDAHVEAPTPGSVILAGVLLKMGGYGLIRFAFPLFPEAALAFAPLLATLAVIAIVYGALVAMVQPDMKKLVAYSSVSHMGFVVLGIAAMNVQGVQGAIYQMLAHGISTGGLFAVVGMLSDRRHTRLISDFGGLKSVMPRLTAAFLVITLASVGLPGLNGFIGEFLILLGRVPLGSALRRSSPGSASSCRPSTCCGCSSGSTTARSPMHENADLKDLSVARVGGRRAAVRAVDRDGRGAQPVPGADGAGRDPHRAAAGIARADARRRRLALVVLGTSRAGRWPRARTGEGK